MALKACRECGKSISTKAKKCLHGGIETLAKSQAVPLSWHTSAGFSDRLKGEIPWRTR